jgi:formamidopyrimidine-DNA glycosylase
MVRHGVTVVPELPEVETVRRGLEPVMTGTTIQDVEVRRPDLRVPFPPRFAERLRGRRVLGLGRRAKYLLADLDDGEVLVMHLGMSGSFRIEDDAHVRLPGDYHHFRSKNAAHDHVVFRLSNGAIVTYNDPRRFGLMFLTSRTDISAHRVFAGLGPEPLGNELDGLRLAALLHGRRTSLKAALLDQRIVAGLGNIYVCEALNLARLSPRRIAATLGRGDGRASRRAERLAQAIRDTIAAAVEAGGSSLRDYVRADGELGMFQHSFRVYDRAGVPCPTGGCRGVVERIIQSGRSTFFCPHCQR